MKDTFILRANYDDLFQTLTAQQAGEVIQAIYAHVHKRAIPPFSSPEARITFKCIQKDITFDINKYQKMCEKRKASAEKRWTTKNAKKCKCIHHEDENEDEEMRKDELLLTAQGKPAQGESALLKENTPRAKTLLQQFSNRVIENFENSVQTDEQKHIWFKRNCRNLRDILNFCNRDITLALQTIRVCILRLKKAGLTGGYEAVCRHLPEYMAQAQQELEEEYGYTK